MKERAKDVQSGECSPLETPYLVQLPNREGWSSVLILAGDQHLVLSWVNTSVKADIIINGCFEVQVCFFFHDWICDGRTLGASICMFVSSICGSTLWGFGSYKASSFSTQRALSFLDETVIKSVCWAQMYPSHRSDGSSFHFSVCISCEKMHPL